MSRRITVILDQTEGSLAAEELAIRRARWFGAHLTGIALISPHQVEAEEGGAPAGAIGFARHAIQERLSQMQHEAQERLTAFMDHCHSAGLEADAQLRVGNPQDDLVADALYTDLIVSSNRHTLFLEGSEPTDRVLKSLVSMAAAPVISVPSRNLPDRLLICLDGSVNAARAMKAYVRLSQGLFDHVAQVVLLNVNEDLADGMDLLKPAQAYLRHYGIDSELKVRSGHVADTIAETATEMKYPLLVMGALGQKSGLSDMLFGSSARQVMEEGRSPLFLHH